MNIRKKATGLLPLVGLWLLIAGNADAAAGFALLGTESGTVNSSVPNVIDIYEYRSNLAESGSLSGLGMGGACTGYSVSTVPIMVVFGGNDGTGSEYGGFTTIAANLDAKTCTRMVYVQFKNANGHFNGAVPNMAAPANTVNSAAANIEWAMDAVLRYYFRYAKRVTYVGGSASAGLGAKLLERKFYDLIKVPSVAVPWSRVKRFIFAGPPLGNTATACRYTKAGALYDLVVWRYIGINQNCSSYLNWLGPTGANDGTGNLYGKATADAKSMAASAGLRINMLVGTSDELFGWTTQSQNYATGPQGVVNFMDVSGLSAGLSAAPSSSTVADGYSGSAITYSTTDATHSTVWSRPDVVKTMCYLAARETSSMGSFGLSTYLQKCD